MIKMNAGPAFDTNVKKKRKITVSPLQDMKAHREMWMQNVLTFIFPDVKLRLIISVINY